MCGGPIDKNNARAGLELAYALGPRCSTPPMSTDTVAPSAYWGFYRSFTQAGFTDTFRITHPTGMDYSWFDRSPDCRGGVDGGATCEGQKRGSVENPSADHASRDGAGSPQTRQTAARASSGGGPPRTRANSASACIRLSRSRRASAMNADRLSAAPASTAPRALASTSGGRLTVIRSAVV